jgi:hypothetical protein
MYRYSKKLRLAVAALPDGSVAKNEAWKGLNRGDLVTTLADALCQYAEQFKERYAGEYSLSEDHVLGAAWLEMYHAMGNIMNGEGLFDGGTLSHMLVTAAKDAGFKDEEL